MYILVSPQPKAISKLTDPSCYLVTYPFPCFSQEWWMRKMMDRQQESQLLRLSEQWERQRGRKALE